jgi:CysZ protein
MAFDHFVTGFRLLSKPGIRLWVVLPLLINIALFVGITALAIDYFGTLLGSLTDWLPGWLGFIAWLIWGLFGLTLLFVYGYTFTIIANLIASPFYGVLAERTQQHLDHLNEAEALNWASIKAIAWRSFVRELRKLMYFLPRILGIFLLCLILSFVPVLNLATPFIVFLWGAWSMSLQYLDYPADINLVTFDELRQQAKTKRRLLTGFGGLVLLGTSVPLLNLLVLPAAVTGATSLWLKEFDTAAKIDDDDSSSAQVNPGIVKVGKSLL